MADAVNQVFGQNVERELDWNDEIIQDAKEFILLPAGDYEFTVNSFERGRHAGSENLPPCPKAEVTIFIETEEGITTIKHSLFLHSKTEGMLSAFFGAIGLKKHGEPLRMNWTNVPGAKGKCKISVKNWTNDDGEVKQFNKITKFYYEEDLENEESQGTTEGTAKGFQPGTF